jgi:hypothetical protein
MGTGIVILLWSLGVGGIPPDVYTMRNRNLEIPIRTDQSKRAEIRELVLYVSTDQGRTWTQAGLVQPDQETYKFHAPSDGLYWFNVCAVFRDGSRDPEDISAAPPKLKVLIDTVTPAIRLIAAERAGDEVQVAWEAQDVRADASSLRLDYRAADQGPNAPWQPVPVSPGLSGQARFRPQTNGPITLRVQITDSSGMPATALKDLPAALVNLTSTASTNPAPVMAAPAPAAPPAIQQTNSVAPPPPPPAVPLGQMPNMAGSAPPPAPVADVPPPAAVAPAPVPPPAPPAASEHQPSGPTPLAPLRSGPDAAPRPPVMGSGSAPDFGGPADPSSRPQAAEVQHVRDRQVQLDFEVDRQGPSGVKKIEVYMTWDDGHSWMKWWETANTNPPLQLTLPDREGPFGFRLVLYSGAMRSEGPPRPGDSPQVRLFVDWTRPDCTLYTPTMDPSQPNALVLHYKATDPNLVTNSIALEYSTRPDGDWKMITAPPSRPSSLGHGIRECTWSLPTDPPDAVYMRMTALDLAGNRGEFITRDPITVDLNKPTVKKVGIIRVGGLRP